MAEHLASGGLDRFQRPADVGGSCQPEAEVGDAAGPARATPFLEHEHIAAARSLGLDEIGLTIHELCAEDAPVELERSFGIL